MSIRSWGPGRLAALTILYWLAVTVVAVLRAMQRARTAAATYEAAHPGTGDYLATTGVAWSLPLAALVLLGPPIAVLALWWFARRSTGG